MKVAVIGATGNAGSRLVTELLKRVHEVTGIARNIEQLERRPSLTAQTADVKDEAGLAEALAGHDAAVHSVRFISTDPRAVIAAVKSAGVRRLLVVGGAGSLKGPDGIALLDAPGFPEAYRPEAGGGREFLNTLKAEHELDWTYLSPSMMFLPGERTGKFRLGNDSLLTGADGKSWISYEDYAVAMVDELENPRHTRARFTIGY